MPKETKRKSKSNFFGVGASPRARQRPARRQTPEKNPGASERKEARKDRARRYRRATRRLFWFHARYTTDYDRRTRPSPLMTARIELGINVRASVAVSIRPRFIEKTGNFNFTTILATAARRQTIWQIRDADRNRTTLRFVRKDVKLIIALQTRLRARVGVRNHDKINAPRPAAK